MDNALKILYETVKDRQTTKTENSYTCYLFEQGLDKILKKCGEEVSETIIAAKTYDNDRSEQNKTDLENEICDVLYHLSVLMVNEGVKLESIEAILKARSKKIGNKKEFKQVDHNS